MIQMIQLLVIHANAFYFSVPRFSALLFFFLQILSSHSHTHTRSRSERATQAGTAESTNWLLVLPSTSFAQQHSVFQLFVVFYGRLAFFLLSLPRTVHFPSLCLVSVQIAVTFELLKSWPTASEKTTTTQTKIENQFDLENQNRFKGETSVHASISKSMLFGVSVGNVSVNKRKSRNRKC